jgi:hypothetical protein
MPDLPLCPICHTSEPVLKVSQVYVSGITEPANRSDQDRARLEAVFGKEVKSPVEIRQAVHLFGPPAGRNQVTRPIHPDMYMYVFSAVTAVILINTFTAQRTFFWVILGIYAIFGVVYYFTRNSVVGGFRKRQEVDAAERDAVNRAVGDWMRLYYCTMDGCVFDPARPDTAPVEEIQRYLAHGHAGQG